MRVAQFIKLDGRVPNERNLDLVYSSQVRGPKGVMVGGLATPLMALVNDISVSPFTKGESPVCPGPIDPPNYLIRYHMLLQGVHERRSHWSHALRLSAYSHTVCESCICQAEASGDMTTHSTWIKYSEYNQLSRSGSRISWTLG